MQRGRKEKKKTLIPTRAASSCYPSPRAPSHPCLRAGVWMSFPLQTSSAENFENNADGEN